MGITGLKRLSCQVKAKGLAYAMAIIVLNGRPRI